LFGIAAHKTIDRARKARAKPIDDRVLQTKPAGPGSDPHIHLSQAELLQALERALAKLPHRQRACWLLRKVKGMSQAQIGRILGLSPCAGSYTGPRRIWREGW
jgi:RNA polymerase sigma-70 factor (ECF subfamily)